MGVNNVGQKSGGDVSSVDGTTRAESDFNRALMSSQGVVECRLGACPGHATADTNGDGFFSKAETAAELARKQRPLGGSQPQGATAPGAETAQQADASQQTDAAPQSSPSAASPSSASSDIGGTGGQEDENERLIKLLMKLGMSRADAEKLVKSNPEIAQALAKTADQSNGNQGNMQDFVSKIRAA